MLNRFTRYAMAALTVSTLVTALNAVTLSRDEKADILNNVNAFAAKLPSMTRSLSNKLDRANSTPNKLSVEQLEKIVNAALRLAPTQPSNDTQAATYYTALIDAQEKLVAALSSYHISGVAFAVDPNGAFFVDNQNPEIAINFTNEKGESVSRQYQASIDSIGFKFEFAIKLDVFFFNTPTNFYEANKVIELGTGVEIQCAFGSGLSLMYVPFTNVPGGMFILALPIGFCHPTISMVTGGTLTPIN